MEKRKFLYYNINNTENNKINLIYDYIIQNNIKCNENSNGLLLNLSAIEDIHIDKIYDLYNLKNNQILYDLSKFESKPKAKKKTEIKYKKYELNKLEKIILSYS